MMCNMTFDIVRVTTSPHRGLNRRVNSVPLEKKIDLSVRLFYNMYWKGLLSVGSFQIPFPFILFLSFSFLHVFFIEVGYEIHEIIFSMNQRHNSVMSKITENGSLNCIVNI